MKIIKNSLLTGLLTALVFGFLPVGHADDTDIYVNNNNPTGGIPMIMFTMDWRPNLASTKCTRDITLPDNSIENECQFLVDLGYMRNDGAGGVPGDISFFELIRSALMAVFADLPAGLKLGLMINHDNTTSPKDCAGNASNTLCSNGAYVLSGFEDVDPDNLNNMKFFRKFSAIPLPQGNETHKWQGKELFYEFFLYLVGGKVYNGHVGWVNWGTGADSLNIDDEDDTIHNVPFLTPEPYAELIWDTAIEEDGYYISPLVNAPQCSKLFMINLMFQVAQQDNESNEAILGQIPGQQGMTGVVFKTNNEDVSTLIKYMFDKDLSEFLAPDADGNDVLPGKQNVTSYYIIDSRQSADNQKAAEYARSGGTGAPLVLSDDPRVLIETLRNVFDEILSVSTTFVAPSIPVNVFNRVERIPEVYVSLFQADDDALPFWDGNLKKLKLDTENKLLVDQLDYPAVGLQGRIDKNALTFWTDVNDLPDDPPDDDFNAGKDGRKVPRGGGGSRIPGFRDAVGVDPGFSNPTGAVTKDSKRKIYTDAVTLVDGNSNLIAFNAEDADALTGGLAQSLLTTGVNADKLFEAVTGITGGTWATWALTADALQQAAVLDQMLILMRWNRGWDRIEDPLNLGTYIYQKRRWMQSDALHARPVPINYGDSDGTGSTYSETNPNIRIVLATNDGLIRMVQANDTPENTAGVEKWAVLPREVIYKTKRLMDNNAGTPVHPYLIDGEIAVYSEDLNGDGNFIANDGDKVIMVIGQRRGGKTYFALDISDPDTPKMLWRIRSGDTGFEQLGQTWSQPRLGEVIVDLNEDGDTDDDGEGRRSVMMIGGGYNGDDDSDGIGDLGKDERDQDNPFVGSDDDEGNAIFIVDVFTGELIWKAIKTPGAGTAGPQTDKSLFYHDHMTDSIAASLTIADTGGDNAIDRFYVGDTAGVVWRGDLVGTKRSNWQVTRILSVGRHYYENPLVDETPGTLTAEDNANDRRFHHRADFVEARDGLGNVFDAVIIGSGDRPHPLGSEVENFLYMFKDSPAVPALADETSNLKYHDDLADLTDNCLQGKTGTIASDFDGCTDTEAFTNLANGWRIQLNNCEDGSTASDCGEKILARPLTVDGVIYVTSYLPPLASLALSCSPKEGSGLFYKIDLFTSAAVENFDLSNDLNGIVLDRTDTLLSPGIPTALVPAGGNLGIRPDLQVEELEGAAGRRSYWYERYQKTTTPSS